MKQPMRVWLLLAAVQGGAVAPVAGQGFDVAVEDTMRRVRIDVPYIRAESKAGALTVRPHPGSLPKLPAELQVPPATGILRAARLSAAQGEAEGFQVLILAKDADLPDVTLEASPLMLMDGKATLAASQVSFHTVGYVKTEKPAYPVERTGWFADPLLNAMPFTVTKGEVQPVWVTLRVPHGTPPGTYTGNVWVKSGNAEKQAIPVQLRVWGFALPEKGSQLKMAFNWDEAGTAAIHGAADWQAKDLKRKYMDCLLEHRMGVDNIYRGTPPLVADVKYAVERGAGSFNLLNVGWPASYTDAQLAATLKRIEAAMKEVEAAGVADKAYVFGFDENYREVAIPQIYGAIGKQFPKLKRLASTGPRGKPADEHVDIWAMSLGTYFAALQAGHVARLQPKGVQFWLYLSSAAGPPRPNWWIENALIEARTLFWLAYQVDADGCLYYFINYAEARPLPIAENAGPYTRWNPRSFPGHNGDGQLIYAGNSGPLPSVRMANIRDGVEDHEYLKLLERLLVEKGKAKNHAEARSYIKDRFVRFVGVNFWIHTHEAEVLRAVRDSVAEEIEKLSRMAPPPP